MIHRVRAGESIESSMAREHRAIHRFTPAFMVSRVDQTVARPSTASNGKPTFCALLRSLVVPSPRNEIVVSACFGLLFVGESGVAPWNTLVLPRPPQPLPAASADPNPSDAVASGKTPSASASAHLLRSAGQPPDPCPTLAAASTHLPAPPASSSSSGSGNRQNR